MMTPVLPPSALTIPRMRVLVVDDMPQVRQGLCQFLELAGGMVIVGQAANGQEAVRLAAELTPDVIVMDLEMPGMDGFEAARRIKKQKCAPRIVILSVHASPEDQQSARLAGADAFIMKGASFRTLIEAILHGVEKRE